MVHMLRALGGRRYGQTNRLLPYLGRGENDRQSIPSRYAIATPRRSQLLETEAFLTKYPLRLLRTVPTMSQLAAQRSELGYPRKSRRSLGPGRPASFGTGGDKHERAVETDERGVVHQVSQLIPVWPHRRR